MNSTSSSNTYLFKNQKQNPALFGVVSSQRFAFSTSNDAGESVGSGFKNVSKRFNRFSY